MSHFQNYLKDTLAPFKKISLLIAIFVEEVEQEQKLE